MKMNQIQNANEGVLGGFNGFTPIDEPPAKELPERWRTWGRRGAILQGSLAIFAIILPSLASAGDPSIQMIFCDPGEYTIGSPATEKGREGDFMGKETQRKVTIEHGFWIGKTEVTQAQYFSVMSKQPWKVNPSVPTGVNYPASYVSWNDAMTFCRKLTVNEQAAGRLKGNWEYTLPSEEQWEYACRAGTTTAFSFGSDEGSLDLYAWYAAPGKTNILKNDRHGHPVDAKRPNQWGIYEMHGNVAEWCRDWFEEESLDSLDPVTMPQTRFRVIRGGAWNSAPGYCRSSKRSNGLPTERESFIGFRIVKVPVR